MTKLDFLKEHFQNYIVTITEPENGDPYAKISVSETSEPVTVYYDPCDHQMYMVRFAFQHVHCSDEAEAIRYAEDYLNGDRASIEFFLGDSPVFGGDIEKSVLDNFTAKNLADVFGNIFTRGQYDFIIKVRSALPQYNFDGHFEKNAAGRAGFVKQKPKGV